MNSKLSKPKPPERTVAGYTVQQEAHVQTPGFRATLAITWEEYLKRFDLRRAKTISSFIHTKIR